jgi:hypothetical protein
MSLHISRIFSSEINSFQGHQWTLNPLTDSDIIQVWNTMYEFHALQFILRSTLLKHLNVFTSVSHLALIHEKTTSSKNMIYVFYNICIKFTNFKKPTNMTTIAPRHVKIPVIASTYESHCSWKETTLYLHSKQELCIIKPDLSHLPVLLTCYTQQIRLALQLANVWLKHIHLCRYTL